MQLLAVITVWLTNDDDAELRLSGSDWAQFLIDEVKATWWDARASLWVSGTWRRGEAEIALLFFHHCVQLHCGWTARQTRAQRLYRIHAWKLKRGKSWFKDGNVILQNGLRDHSGHTVFSLQRPIWPSASSVWFRDTGVPIKRIWTRQWCFELYLSYNVFVTLHWSNFPSRHMNSGENSIRPYLHWDESKISLVYCCSRNFLNSHAYWFLNIPAFAFTMITDQVFHVSRRERSWCLQLGSIRWVRECDSPGLQSSHPCSPVAQ